MSFCLNEFCCNGKRKEQTQREGREQSSVFCVFQCVRHERDCDSCFPLAASPHLQFKYIAVRGVIVCVHLFSILPWSVSVSVSSCEQTRQSQSWTKCSDLCFAKYWGVILQQSSSVISDGGCPAGEQKSFRFFVFKKKVATEESAAKVEVWQ